MTKRKKLAFNLISITIIFLFLELMSAVVYKTYVSQNEIISQSILKRKGCVEVLSSSELHFMLGTVYKKDSGCLHKNINDHGFMSRNFNIKEIEKYHDVLILGGSVAEELYIYKSNDKGLPISDIERRMNKNFVDAIGRKFRVFSAARIDMRQPQQIIMLSLLAAKVDTVINIEGYNEQHGINSRSLISPSTQEFVVHKYYDELKANFKDRENLRSHWLTKNTYLGKMLYAFKIKNSFKKLEEFSGNTGGEPGRVKVFTKKGSYQHYRNMLKSQGGICKTFKLNCYVFLQPIPQLYKKLTKNEYVNSFEGESVTEWRQKGLDYSEMEEFVYSKPIVGLKLFSLIEIFKNEEKRAYSDIIHYYEYPGEDVADGNLMIIEKIISELKKDNILVDL